MRFIFILGCVLAFPLTVAAVSSDFYIRTMVGEDTDPPTTPILTSVTPITSTQIDIEWTPSTDDFLVSGYTVMRDGLHAATTTLTSFSDTGLLPETFYEYTVRAFDSAGNISSSSLPLGTTTIAVPPTPTTTPTTTSAASTPSTGSGKLMLSKNLTITTDVTSAQLEWSTSRPSRFELRWGKTASYELGFITTERFRNDHLTNINELMPGTTYEYELIGYNTINTVPQVIGRGQFTTKVAATPVVPPNVWGLTAVVENTDVRLQWQNPGPSYAYTIRVVRNHLYYPVDIHDGMVVYQGDGEEFSDSRALSAYGQQYYTVFVMDAAGNVSSGAIVRVERSVLAVEGPGIAHSGGPSSTTTPTSSPFLAPTVLLPLLDPSMIRVMQDGTTFSFVDEHIVLNSEKPFIVRIPAEHLPQQLKSIIVTLLNPTNHHQSYTFLLRLNQDKTAYETTLAALELVGVSHLMVEIYDYEAKVVGRYGKQVEFVNQAAITHQVIFPDMFMQHITPACFFSWFALLLLIVILLWWWRRNHSREQ